MTYVGEIMAPFSTFDHFGLTGYGLVLEGLSYTYKKATKGGEVLPDPNLCVFEIYTDGNQLTALEALPDVLVLSYEEITNEL